MLVIATSLLYPSSVPNYRYLQYQFRVSFHFSSFGNDLVQNTFTGCNIIKTTSECQTIILSSNDTYRFYMQYISNLIEYTSVPLLSYCLFVLVHIPYSSQYMYNLILRIYEQITIVGVNISATMIDMRLLCRMDVISSYILYMIQPHFGMHGYCLPQLYKH